jgi:proline racemase
VSYYNRFSSKQDYEAPAGSLIINAIDMHTGGEPLRVITSGYPEIQTDSLLDYRRQLKQHHDHLRTALMFEPRSHADMYGALVLSPFTDYTYSSTIFLHNEGYSNICGHAVIAIMTLAMQMDWVDVIDCKASMNIEAP